VTATRTLQANTQDVLQIAAALQGRRWIRRNQPFPHVIAYDVFTPAVYHRLESDFRTLLAETADRPYLSAHGIDGRTVDDDISDHLYPLLTRGWHDLLASISGIRATGHIAAGMHHHRPGSQDGFAHNDLNPGWFLGQPGAGEVALTGPGIDYTSGRLLRDTDLADADLAPVQTVRGAALLFYLGNPPWRPGDGGSTGLYRSAGADIRRPVAVVPPLNNSLLLFTCTPRSFHGFISNRRSERNSIVMWLHRSKPDVVAQWGEAAIVPYGQVPDRRAER
jgi:2OG-Fe(II) oxygenase superfamily